MPVAGRVTSTCSGAPSHERTRWSDFWVGAGVGLAAVVGSGSVAALGVGWLWSRIPEWLGWNTGAWAFWPEVVPPDGEYVFIGFGLLVLVLTTGVYLVARRITGRINFALAALTCGVVLSLVLDAAEPRIEIVALWPTLIGCVAWCGAVLPGGRRPGWPIELAMALAAAAACFMMVPGFIDGFMGDGLSTVASLAASWSYLLALVLPAVDPMTLQPRIAGSSGYDNGR